MPHVMVTWLPKTCRNAAVRKEVADAIIKAMVGVKSADVSPNNLVVRFGEAVDVRATLRPPPPFFSLLFFGNRRFACAYNEERRAASLPAYGRASRCQKATRTALISRRSQRATKEHAKSTVSSAGRGHRRTEQAPDLDRTWRAQW